MPVPAPEQAPDVHPAQFTQELPLGHCASFVHQHGTPAAVHSPLGDVTLSQLPIEQDHALATDLAVSQSSASLGALPVHMPPAHWPSALTHFPIEQSASATHRHAAPVELSTGAGVRFVVHAVPPPPTQGIEVGAGSHP